MAAKYDDINRSFFLLFPQRASVTSLVHTAVVGFVIRTAVSVPADTASVEDNAISAPRGTIIFLIVSVSVSSVSVSVRKPDLVFSNLYGKLVVVITGPWNVALRN